MARKSLSAATLTALAASYTPALAHVAPWSGPDAPPLPVQFLISIALMAVAGAVVVWEGVALVLERKRRRVVQPSRYSTSDDPPASQFSSSALSGCITPTEWGS